MRRHLARRAAARGIIPLLLHRDHPRGSPPSKPHALTRGGVPTHGNNTPLVSTYVTSASTSAAHDARPGVYGLEGLHEPDDFERLAARAVAKSDDMVSALVRGAHHITSAHSAHGDDGRMGTSGGSAVAAAGYGSDGVGAASGVIDDLDEISDTVCAVVDVAEVCRNTHPDQRWVAAAVGRNKRREKDSKRKPKRMSSAKKSNKTHFHLRCERTKLVCDEKGKEDPTRVATCVEQTQASSLRPTPTRVTE